MQKATQCSKILEFLREHGSITQMDALREFGCMRLASRIADLRKDLVQIRSEIVVSKNSKGEDIRFARYYLMGEKE